MTHSPRARSGRARRRAEADLRTAFDAVRQAWQSGEAGVRAIFARRGPLGEVGDEKAGDHRGAMLGRGSLRRRAGRVLRRLRDRSILPRGERRRANAARGKAPTAAAASVLRRRAARFVAARASAGCSAFQREFLAWARRRNSPRRKVQRNVLSFDDLLTRLRDALRSAHGSAAASSATRAAIRRGADRRVPGHRSGAGGDLPAALRPDTGRLYLIGDPKQAIYGFRGADVFSYLARARARATARHELDTNRRSVTPLVDAVNAIFDAQPATRSSCDEHRTFARR